MRRKEGENSPSPKYRTDTRHALGSGLTLARLCEISRIINNMMLENIIVDSKVPLHFVDYFVFEAKPKQKKNSVGKSSVVAEEPGQDFKKNVSLDPV